MSLCAEAFFCKALKVTLNAPSVPKVLMVHRHVELLLNLHQLIYNLQEAHRHGESDKNDNNLSFSRSTRAKPPIGAFVRA